MNKKSLRKAAESIKKIKNKGKISSISIFLIKLQIDIILFLYFVCIAATTTMMIDIKALNINYLIMESMK